MNNTTDPVRALRGALATLTWRSVASAQALRRIADEMRYRMVGPPIKGPVYGDELNAWANRIEEVITQQPEASNFTATFRCERNGVVGSTNAPIHSVTVHDDGVTEVIIDYWPAPEAPAQEAVAVIYNSAEVGGNAIDWKLERGAQSLAPGTRLYTAQQPAIPEGWLQTVADATAALDKRGDRQMAARLMALHSAMLAARPTQEPDHG